MLTDVIVKTNWKSINDFMFVQYCAWMELIENIIENENSLSLYILFVICPS